MWLWLARTGLKKMENFYSMTDWGEFVMANSEGMLMVEDKSGGEYLIGIGEMTGLVYGNS